jgi:thiol:disulfide interchange protein DsbD
MLRISNRLFLALALLMFQPVSYAQLRELGSGAPGPVKAQHLTAELISDSGAVAPGSASRVALLLTLEPGWHVYWAYAGDSGEPPRVIWSLPPGITVEPMRYPAPSRLPLGPLMDYGYEGTAVFPFDLSALQQLPLGNTKLKAHVQWLVCREVCLPGKAFLGLDLDVVSKAPDDTNKLIAAAVQAEPVNTPDSVRVEVNATRNLLTLHVITGKSERSAEYDPLDDGSIRNAAGQPITPTADGVALVTERERLS